MTKVVNFKKNCSSANIAVYTTIYCAPKNARPGLEHAHWDCIPKSGDNENTGSFSNSSSFSNSTVLRSWMTKVVNFKKNCSSANIAVHTTIYCAPKNARPGLEHAHWDCIPKSGDNENTGSFSNSTVAKLLHHPLSSCCVCYRNQAKE
ncbi:hypothetical protein JTB14_035186 [Gonioctena quinquepunctata]|nr:hypothetical protein JTB14_035186 [Gonioctena quinquepunctata]